MNATKRWFDNVVTAPEGANLSIEPSLNFKTIDGRKNIILKVPFGTRLASESGGFHIDERFWVIVRPEIGNGEKIGWMALDFDSWSGDKFEVSASEGTDLRREPVLKSKTEDGRDNVVLSLPELTRLIPLNNVVTNDGHVWRLVILHTGSSEMGWVADDDLARFPTQTLDSAAGYSETPYTFKYLEIPRGITEINLKTALTNGHLSIKKLTKEQIMIELDKPYQNIKQYYTTPISLQKNMTIFPPIF